MEKNQKIGVLGAGVEGMAVARYLSSHGFTDVTLYDECESLEEEVTVPTVLGSDAFGQIGTCDVVFRSPGVHPSKLKNFTGKVTSTTQFFLGNAPGTVIGVTGTKGKGTTSALLYEILKADGRDAYLGGNIGESPLNFLDDLKDDSFTVLELSSFQLQDLTISPHVAIVLMTTTEHLDYHTDQKEYWEAKLPIVKFQKADDVCIVNVDYEYADHILKAAPGRKLMLSRNKALKEGTHIEGPVMLYCTPTTCEMLGNTSKVALPGPHNLENVLAAATCARTLDVPIKTIQQVIYEFQGLPHRLELVREVEGVKYYNDSFSTTPETSIAAARAFQAPTMLICGGSEKNSDYSEWAKELQNNQNVTSVFLMGVTADRMEKDLKAAQPQEFPVKVYRVGSLEEAVKSAKEKARSGDVVIMSPAAASFDMFKNYKERGQTFRDLVNAL